ncbi:hypothetical protein G6F22_010440 [Rhizopus arrhizus]|nr:hypothetical protein G6F22_010440 [Rhizopus arrhizus]
MRADRQHLAGHAVATQFFQQVLLVAARQRLHAAQHHHQRVAVQRRLRAVAETQWRIGQRQHAAGGQLQHLQRALAGQRFQRAAAEIDDAVERALRQRGDRRIPLRLAFAGQRGDLLQARDARVPRRAVEYGQRGQQHAGQAAGHGEGAVAAGRRHQQGAGIAAAGTAAGQLAIGVAGDVEEACVIHVAAHAVHCRHAFRAGATAAERDQQGRAVALQVQRRVGQQAGGMHHAHVGRPLRVDRVGHHLGDEAGAAGAGEQHALVGIVEAVAEEGLQAIAGTRQILRKGFPQRRLLGDFAG